MSEFEKRVTRDYSKFDQMSTDALREILRRDSYLPNDEQTDVDAILYIAEVIAGREKERRTGAYPDVDAAWKSFQEHYQPFTDERPLFEDTEDSTESKGTDSEPNPIQEIKHSRKRKKYRFPRAAGIAAAVAAAVLAGSLTAYAFGFDLWGAVSIWTKDSFGFVTGQVENSLRKDIPRPLKDLAKLMSENGVPVTELPGYIPPGYEAVDVRCDPQTNVTDFFCQLQKDESSITLTYSVYASEQAFFQFEKNAPNPEIYEANGIRFYIMSNMDRYFASWTVGNMGCYISGVESHREMMKIIDSICGG